MCCTFERTLLIYVNLHAVSIYIKEYAYQKTSLDPIHSQQVPKLSAADRVDMTLKPHRDNQGHRNDLEDK